MAEFMSTVLSIHEKFSLMIKEVFSSHKSFSSALDKVHVHVCLYRSTLHIIANHANYYAKINIVND